MRLLREESKDNLRRVRSLLNLFDAAEKDDFGAADERAELLRAAVVFLHSSIEEVVRNIFIVRLPTGSPEVLNELAYSEYPVTNRSKGVLLGDLLRHHGGKFVENVIVDAINAHIDRLNINNSVQLVSQLKKARIDCEPLNPLLSDLDSLMARRHQIVHQMDRSDELDPDTRPISPICVVQAKAWLEAVQKFHAEVILQSEQVKA